MGFFNTGKCEICGASDGVRQHEQLDLTVCRTCALKYKSVTKGNSDDLNYFTSLMRFPVCSNKARETIKRIVNNEPVTEQEEEKTVLVSVADEIEKLWQLCKEGAISKEEYEVLKRKIVNR